MYVRAPSGLRIEETEEADQGSRGLRPQDDRARRSPARPLGDRRHLGLVGRLHPECRPDGRRRQDPAFRGTEEIGPGIRPYSADGVRARARASGDLEFAFDAGGMVRSAMNEGRSTPISIRVTGKNQKVAHKIATAIKHEVKKIDGVVDARVIQRLNYPEYVIKVDRAKAAELGLISRRTS